MTERVVLTTAELNKRLAEGGIMYSLDEKRTVYEVARDFGLLHLSEMCIEDAVEEQTEVY